MKNHIHFDSFHLLTTTGMPPKCNSKPKPMKGPPQQLILCIKHLRSLVKNLPESLTENPADLLYQFYQDPDVLEDHGYLGRLSHALEVSFVMHLQPLQGGLGSLDRGLK
jgi:hypothetical protein